MVDANRLGPHAGSSDARPTLLVAGTTPRRPTRAVAPRPTYGAEGTCHGHCLAHPGAGTPGGGNDTPKAREIGYSAASPRSCVWWRYCGRHRGRSDRRDRRWSARGDRRRHRRCCPWRYCRREDCRGCAAWRPAPGEAVHLRRRIAGAPKPTRLTPTRDPGTGHLPSGWRCTAATGSCRTFGGARPPVASATAPGSAPALRSLRRMGRAPGDRGRLSHSHLKTFSVATNEYAGNGKREGRVPHRRDLGTSSSRSVASTPA